MTKDKELEQAWQAFCEQRGIGSFMEELIKPVFEAGYIAGFRDGGAHAVGSIDRACARMVERN